MDEDRTKKNIHFVQYMYIISRAKYTIISHTM